MARIKHIAIRTPYPEKTAAFYKDVFGLKEVGQARAGESPRDAAGYTGIHHLGFMVDDIGSCLLGPHVQESRRCSASRSSRRTPSSRGWSRRRRSSPMEQAPDGVLHGEERRRLDRRLPRGGRAQIPITSATLSAQRFCRLALSAFREAADLFQRTLAVHPHLESGRANLGTA